MGKDKKDINLETGRRLKLCRKAVGMTAEELAEKMEVSVTAVSDWETGRSGLISKRQVARVKQLANILGVNPDYLTCKSAYPNAKAEDEGRMEKAEFDTLNEAKQDKKRIEIIKLTAALRGYEVKEANFTDLDIERDYFEIKKRRKEYLTLYKEGRKKLILSDTDVFRIANVLADSFDSLIKWNY